MGKGLKSNPTETSRNFTRGGIGGCLVLVCIPVRDFLSVLGWNGTEYTTLILYIYIVNQKLAFPRLTFTTLKIPKTLSTWEMIKDTINRFSKHHIFIIQFCTSSMVSPSPNLIPIPL